DTRVVRARPTEVRLAVVVATGPHQVEAVGAAERRREAHDAGVVLGRCLEGSGEGVPDDGVVRRSPGQDGDAVVDALTFVADGEEQLVASDRAAQVEAELGAGVVRDREGGRVRGATLPLE